jgi:hypothetical protein
VALARTAPCLLPEFEATEQLEVAGARYWPQRWVAGGGAGAALAKLFRQRSLFVKKKAGALGYADDPSGIRSLLSRVLVRGGAGDGAGAAPRRLLPAASSGVAAAHAAPGGCPADPAAPPPPPAPRAGSPASGMDIVALCNTFSASPFIMAFAKHVCASPAAAGAGGGGSGAGGGGGSPELGGGARLLRAPGSFFEFCHGALYECITQEKAGALPWYLQLYCLLQALHSGGGGGGGGMVVPAAQAAGGLTGGAGPAVGLASLQLALGYYGSSLAAAAAVCGEASRAGGGDELSWQPLLQPVFLQSLQQLLQRLLGERRVALGGAAGAGAAGGGTGVGGGGTLLGQYISGGWGGSGSGGAAADDEEEWRWQLLGCQLSMAGLPEARQLQAALQAAEARAAQGLLPPGWRQASPLAALPVLLGALPGTDVRALMLLAQHL